MTRATKIAITIPPDDLAAADRLAAKLGRSRSWVLSEGLREGEASGDVTAWPTANERLTRVDEPLRFATYDEFDAWRRAQRDEGRG